MRDVTIDEGYNNQIQKAIIEDDSIAIENILISDQNFYCDNNFLKLALSYRRLDIVRRLAPYVLRADVIDILSEATEKTDIPVIRILAETLGKLEEEENNILAGSVVAQRIDVIKELIPYCDVSHNNSEMLAICAAHGHVAVAKLLLPHSDARANKSEALYRAVLYNSTDIIDLLFDISDTDEIYNMIEEDLVSSSSLISSSISNSIKIPGVNYFISLYESRQTKQILQDCISNKQSNRKNKIM